jgi:flagellum-specific peptidoglycan hydrolase FlgJ
MTLIYKIALVIFLQPQNQTEYITKYYPVAKLCEVIYGVPTSVQLAQALAESGGGVSYIGKNSNNHFGIKYYPGVFRGDCFTDRAGGEWRKYPTVIQGYFDHAKFLIFHYKHATGKDYKYWQMLRGYGAGNYWQHIGKIIEHYKLNNLDIHRN